MVSLSTVGIYFSVVSAAAALIVLATRVREMDKAEIGLVVASFWGLTACARLFATIADTQSLLSTWATTLIITIMCAFGLSETIRAWWSKR